MLTFQHLKRYTAIFCFAGVVSMPSLAGVHVDVNIGVGSPGYYGVLPIQGVTPSLWNANPIVAIGAALAGAPIYLTVPDKHRRHWKRYCAEYGACGVPVYFVRRGWYNNYYGHAAPPPPPPGPGFMPPPRTMPPRPLRRENTAGQDTLKIMVGNIGRQVTIGTVTDTAIRKSTTRINFCRISAFIWRSGRNIGSDLLCLF